MERVIQWKCTLKTVQFCAAFDYSTLQNREGEWETMRRIRFRYNKYSPGVLYIMVVLGVTLGLLILYEFIIFSGIAEGPEQGPAYFREHPKHAVVLIFALIPVAMLLPVWIAKKWWSRTEEEAKIELYEEHAVLYYKNKELFIKKGDLRISIPHPQPFWYTTYILKVPGHRVVFVKCTGKNEADAGEWLSLDTAMDVLSAYRKFKRGDEQNNSVANFYGINIALGITTPAVFDSSPYYVDYESMLIVMEAPFVTCMIKERNNSVHVVGKIQIDRRLLRNSALAEMQLNRQAILDIVELDEHMEM